MAIHLPTTIITFTLSIDIIGYLFVIDLSSSC